MNCYGPSNQLVLLAGSGSDTHDPSGGWLSLLWVIGVFACAYTMAYFVWIKDMKKRKRIAQTTPLDEQIDRVDSIFDGSIEVSMNRAETRLTDEQLEQIARRHGYTFSRYFMWNRGGPRKIIFRQLNEQGI